MAQGPNLRLVHCPKCASLLQELHGYSLFRCGACGAVLRAKKREPAGDGGNSAETSESIGAAHEQERGIHDRNVKNERLSSSGAGTDVSVSNSAMDKREESAPARRDSASDESAGLRLDRRRAKEETAYAFDHKRYAEDRGNRFMERRFGESSARSKKVLDLASSRAERGRWSFAGDHLEVFLRDSRIVTEHEMTRRYRYPEEGTSDNYRSPSFGRYGEFLGRHSDITDRDRVRELERRRVELLGKLDELSNQMNRSGDIANKSGAGETVPRHKRIASGDPYYAHAGYGVLDEPLIRDSPIGKPPDTKQGHESAHSMESYEMEMSAFYFSPWDGQLNLLEDQPRSFSPGTVRPFHRYAHEPPPGHLSVGYLGFDRDLPVMYPNRSPRHHPSCACSRCCYKYERVPPPRFSPNASSSSKTFEARFNSNLYHRVNPVKIRPQDARHSGDSTSSSNSKYLHSLQMWQEDPDLDIENFVQSRPKTSMVSRRNKKRCHPIAGAAPFMICLNCLELLKLPKELIIKEKRDKQKLRCGGCSAIILFEIENKKLVTSMEKGSSGGAAKDGGDDIQISSTCSDGGINPDTRPSAIRTSSDPYDGSFKLKLTGDNGILEVQPQNIRDSGKMQGLRSPASSLPSLRSKEEECLDSEIAQCDARAECNTSPKPQNLQVSEHFDDPLTNGNENSRMNQEGVSLEKNDACRSTREDASSTTEVEVPPNEYPLTGLSLSEVQPQNASDFGKMQGLHSPASSSPSLRSEEEESLDSVIAYSNVLTRPENDTSPGPQNSHVPKHFDNSPSYQSEDSRIKLEGVSTEKKDACQGTSHDASVTAEVEVPLNEDPHTGLSQDSKDTSKEAKEKVHKRSKSFLAGLIKSYGESQNLENEKPKVTVNGHLIPDSVVKRAEKLAGPVLPGDYWYDFQAGFWGVMNQPCLGIIPPFIEEFRHPMPADCAAGNTGIFINGRELNQRDLDLLASRGLPRTRNRFYAIDISGIVLDEKTREALYNLGKLAPTVERVQCGFGMRVPEEA